MTEQAIRIAADGVPIPKGSNRALARLVGGKAVGVMVEGSSDAGRKRLKEWAATIEAAASAEIERTGVAWPSTESSIVAEVVFWLPRGRTVRRQHPCKKPDIDKLLRTVLDALTNAGLWADDSQVVEVRSAKRYATDARPPGVVIRAKEIPPARAPNKPPNGRK